MEDPIIFQNGQPDCGKGYRLELKIQIGPEYSSLLRNGSSVLVLSNQALMDLAALVNKRFPLDMMSRV